MVLRRNPTRRGTHLQRGTKGVLRETKTMGNRPQEIGTSYYRHARRLLQPRRKVLDPWKHETHASAEATSENLQGDEDPNHLHGSPTPSKWAR